MSVRFAYRENPDSPCKTTLSLPNSPERPQDKNICLTSLTRAKCGVRSTLCWKIPNISGSIELHKLLNHTLVMLQK